MTLIAAVRGSNGIAIAADSQETCGPHRCAVQKIEPRNDGNLHTLIVGSGNADLVDGFIEAFYSALPRAKIRSLHDCKGFVERTLRGYYRNDVRLSHFKDKEFRLIVSAALETTGEYDVWATKAMRLSSIGLYELLGIEEALYNVTVQRMLSPAITIQQAVLAAVYAVTVGKATSHFIDGPISLALVVPRDILRERPEFVSEIEDRLGAYERHLGGLLLACADTTVSPNDLQAHIDGFGSLAKALHRAQLDTVATDLDNTLNSPIPKVPAGTRIELSASGPTVHYDQPPRPKLPAHYPVGVRLCACGFSADDNDVFVAHLNASRR
ncbi:MAG: hypothetical protein ABSG65_07175 [Bryobacteraceae bacterium]|jgi:hypothetical protein